MVSFLCYLLWFFISLIFFVLNLFNISINNNQTWSIYTIQTSKNLKYDFETDDSIQKFITRWKSYNDKQYEPQDLVDLKTDTYIKVNRNWHKLRQEAKDKLEEMGKAFYEKFWKPIYVYSSYRSYSYQKDFISSSCKNAWRCARAGESEHQSWLAIDLWEVHNWQQFLNWQYESYYDWMMENAYKYWFTQSYQKWLEYDNYYPEPWHRRYVWEQLATYLKENWITFTQYYYNIND